MASIIAISERGHVVVAISERCPVEGRTETLAACPMPAQHAELFVAELKAAISKARQQERAIKVGRRAVVERDLDATRERLRQLETEAAEIAAIVEGDQ